MDVRGWVGGLMLGCAAVLGGCAAADTPRGAPLPPARTLQTAELSSLAGEWVGTIRGKPGSGAPAFSSAVRLRVAGDGSFTAEVGGRPGTGQASIEGGKVVFAGSILRGRATLYQGEGRSVLVGEGQLVGREGDAALELIRR